MKRKIIKSLLTAISIVVLIIIGVIAGSFISKGEYINVEAISFSKDKEDELFYIELEPFTINLKQDSSFSPSQQYLKLGLTLVALGEDDNETLNTKIPEVRDIILSYLSKQNSDTIREQEDGQLIIKSELTEVLNNRINSEDDLVVEVLITDLLIQ